MIIFLVFHVFIQFCRSLSNADPCAIDKYFDLLIQIFGGFNRLDFGDERRDVFIEGRAIRRNRNMCHVTDVFDDADRLALGRLGETQEPPRRIVQFARCNEFSALFQRRIDSP